MVNLFALGEEPKMKPRTYFQTAFCSAEATGSYSVPRARAPIDLWLDANEGRTPPDDVLKVEADRKSVV